MIEILTKFHGVKEIGSLGAIKQNLEDELFFFRMPANDKNDPETVASNPNFRLPLLWFLEPFFFLFSVDS